MRLPVVALVLCFSVVNAALIGLPIDEQKKFGDIVDLNKEPETTTKVPAPSSTTAANQSSHFVPLEAWHCGSNDWNKWLAHEFVKQDCPTQMADTNDCCITHDLCYVQQLTQEQCDQVFCQCLDTALKPHGCSHLAISFCAAVQTFGAEAHRNSKDYVPPAEETSTTTTTTQVPSTTEISNFKIVDTAEKRFFQSTVNQTWDSTCYADNTGGSTCKSNLDSCTDGGFTCTYNFCECAQQQLYASSNKERVECQHNLKVLCGEYFSKEEEHHRHHPTDSNNPSWTEESVGLSPALAIFIIICLLVSTGSAVFWLWRYVRYQRQPKCKLHGFANAANSSASSSSSSSTPSNSSSAASFLLTGDEDAESGKLSTSTLNCMSLLKA